MPNNGIAESPKQRIVFVCESGIGFSDVVRQGALDYTRTKGLEDKFEFATMGVNIPASWSNIRSNDKVIIMGHVVEEFLGLVKNGKIPKPKAVYQFNILPRQRQSSERVWLQRGRNAIALTLGRKNKYGSRLPSHFFR